MVDRRWRVPRLLCRRRRGRDGLLAVRPAERPARPDAALVHSRLFPMSYAELQVTSNFSFRRGGSHPEELIDTAADLGFSAIALTDRNTFAGVVRAWER